MSPLAIIILFVVMGLIFLFLEFFIFPGVGLSGVAGVAFVVAGVVMSYINYGTKIGNLSFLGVFILGTIMMVVSLRSGTWKRIMLKTEVSSKVSVKEDDAISVGDEGVAITRLNPVGKAKVNEVIVEAHCPGKFVDQNSPLIVTKVMANYIIVKENIKIN